MIKNLPTLYRKDSWVNAIYDSVALEFTNFKKANQSNLDNINFDKLDERGCSIYEKDLQIRPRETLGERRTIIKSKWLANFKCSVPAMQVTADGYYNGDLIIKYKGDALLEMYTHYINHFETDFSNFLSVIEEIKPAHFGIEWSHKHNKWYEYYDPVRWRTALDWTWREKNVNKWSSVTGTFAQTTWGYCITRHWSGHLTERITYSNGDTN